MVAKLPRPDIASSFSRCRAFQAVCSTLQWKLYKPRVHRRGTRTQATPNLGKRRETATWTPGQATPLANVRWSDLAMADSELPTCRENAAALNWTVSHSFRVWLLARYGSGHYDQRTSWFAWNVTFCWYRSLLQFPRRWPQRKELQDTSEALNIVCSCDRHWPPRAGSDERC